jgi:hypothetical protein
VSRDVDIFHDSLEAVYRTSTAGRHLLLDAGYALDILIERPGFVEAMVRRGHEQLGIQWAQDSAYRFFRLVQHPDFGLMLHPFDLATNKVLDLVGCLEVRDWIDVISCSQHLQPLGYLAWAATGKDPGLSPSFILAEAARSSHYTRDEVLSLVFEGAPPDPADLSITWRLMLREARKVVDSLPAEQVGTCVLDPGGQLLREDSDALDGLLAAGSVQFRRPALRGAFPKLIDYSPSRV